LSVSLPAPEKLLPTPHQMGKKTKMFHLICSHSGKFFSEYIPENLFRNLLYMFFGNLIPERGKIVFFDIDKLQEELCWVQEKNILLPASNQF